MASGDSLYKNVMLDLWNKALTVSNNAFTSSRPSATDQMGDFVVVSLPQGITPYSDTHDTAYVQMACYVRDRQGGIENVPKMGELVDKVRALIPFSDELLTCNQDKPIQLQSKSDGMGFHSTTLQFKILVKL